MATANQNVTAEDLLSATVKYSNKDDASRAYDITANVRIRNGKVSSFENGEVRKIQTESNEQMVDSVATFSSYDDRSLNYNVNNVDEEEAKGILDAIYSFLNSVKSNVTTNTVKV